MSLMRDSKPPNRFYRPELDVVRVIAFFLVFLRHSLPRSGDPRIEHLLKGFAPAFDAVADACGFGLSLFFTLSAFLICELLLRESAAAGSVGVKQFYIRRILRIWPLYYLALVLGVISAFLPHGPHITVIDVALFSIFLGAWRSALYGCLIGPISPLWSISVEEQFYLFAPWVVKYFNRKVLYCFCAAIILVADAWLHYLGSVRANGSRIWADSFVQFQCFAAGILLCLNLRGRVPRIAIWLRLILMAGCCVCWIAASYGLRICFAEASDNPGSWPLIGGYALVALGCVLLLIAFLGVSPELLPRWAIYLGQISFGLYVFHEFALGLVRHLPLARLGLGKIPICPLRVFLSAGLTLVLPLGLTILMAALSYRYFETPFLKMKKRHAIIESQPIAGTS